MAKKLTPKELESYRGLLLHMRGLVAGDMSDLQTDAFGIDGERAGLDTKADGGSDSFYQEFSLELLARDASTLSEIDAALERVREGSYGQCEGCEIWIPRPRLKAVPHARNCIDCQRREEQSA